MAWKCQLSVHPPTVYFYNYGWLDYGVPTLESVLDMVKVVDFALRGGKVAVHCHAGLGRTGVLIACYLVYSQRMGGDEAISHVRARRCVSVARGTNQVLHMHPLHMMSFRPHLPHCSLSYTCTCSLLSPPPHAPQTCTGLAQSRHVLRSKSSSSLTYFSVPFGTSIPPRRVSPPPRPSRSRSTCGTSLSCCTERSRRTSNTFRR